MSLYGPVPLIAVLPEAILLVAACAVLLLGQARRESWQRSIPAWTLLALIVALLVQRGLPLVTGDPPHGAPTGGGLAWDELAGYARLATLIFGVLIVLASWAQPPAAERAEFFSMALFSLAGLLLVGPAADLVVLFLALELVSIPTYVMVTLSRFHPRALEAGTKYFYLGALAAALNAYGFSFLYGVGGTASLEGATQSISLALAQPHSVEYVLAVVGLLLSLGGIFFKIAAVPLHFYIADVYEGAASPVAGLLGFVPKLAGLLAIFKVLQLTQWQTDSGGLFWLLWIVAALSMTVGNVLALMQTSVKRLLAYSGIAHSGYMLVGMLAGPAGGEGLIGDGTAAILYYVFIYGLANLGAFALLGVLRTRGRPCESLRDIAGLVRPHPGAALLMALCMFTLMGLPPSAGFWGKVGLFGSALSTTPVATQMTRTWIIVLVVIAVLNTAVAAAYYLRVMAAVLLYESDEPAELAPQDMPRMGAMLCGFLLLIFMFYPNALLDAGRRATSALREARNPPLPMLRSAAATPGVGPPETPTLPNAALPATPSPHDR